MDPSARDRTQVFYGALLGWRLRAGHPASRYHDTGPVEHTMDPYHSTVCTDDQRTEFGLMSAELG